MTESNDKRSPCLKLEKEGTVCVLQQDYHPRCPCVDYEPRKESDL